MNDDSASLDSSDEKTNNISNNNNNILEQDIDIENVNINNNQSNWNANSATKVNRNEIIHLNVGGIQYVTTRGALLNFSESGHMLSCMFSGKFSLAPTMNQNEYFIDRDGTYFKYILSFLRNGKQFIHDVMPSLSKDILLYLRQEAKYFGLHELIFDSYDTPIKWSVKFYCHNDINGMKDEFVFKRWRASSDYPCVTNTIPTEWINHGRSVEMTFKQRAYFDFKDKASTNEDYDDYDDTGTCIIGYALVYDAKGTKQVIYDKFKIVKEESRKADYVTLKVNFKDKSFATQTSTNLVPSKKEMENNSWIQPFDYPNQECISKLRISVWCHHLPNDCLKIKVRVL